MGFLGMLFWIAVLWLVLRAWRRSHRWVAVGPRDYWPGWSRTRETDRPGRQIWAGSSTKSRDEYIDALETRLSDLEERLDFTEKLLAGKQGSGEAGKQ
jgi:hypothetical protein